MFTQMGHAPLLTHRRLDREDIFINTSQILKIIIYLHLPGHRTPRTILAAVTLDLSLQRIATKPLGESSRRTVEMKFKVEGCGGTSIQILR